VDVYSPAKKTKLPVFIYIHGGGYGIGDGTQDMSAFLGSNDNNFLAVSLQYRVSLFDIRIHDRLTKNLARSIWVSVFCRSQVQRRSQCRYS